MKFIKGYENLYSIDENGNVYSHRSNKYLKPNDDGHGYLYVNLCYYGQHKAKKNSQVSRRDFYSKPK